MTQRFITFYEMIAGNTHLDAAEAKKVKRDIKRNRFQRRRGKK